VAEAGRMADLYRVLGESDDVRSGYSAELAALMLDSSRQCEALERMLEAPLRDHKVLSEQLRLITVSCRSCHASHRDWKTRR
jgi:hypothetical protein